MRVTMRTTRGLFAFPFFLVVAILFLLEKTANAECDSCLYDGSDEDSDCKVYGQLGDDVLIPYHRASQDCLNAHNIKMQAVDTTMLTAMFPNADGTNANVNAFVNWLKTDSGAAVNPILSSMDFFFVESTNGQKPVFLDEIVVKGETYDCTASESDCWNALKVYFEETEEGQEILQSVGQDLYDRARVDSELEQSTVRIAICNQGAVATDGSCDTLAAQIDELKIQNPDSDCSAFGLGPAENAIPGCNEDGSDVEEDHEDDEDETTDTGNATSPGTSSSAATTTGSFSFSGVAKGLLLLLLTSLVF